VRRPMSLRLSFCLRQRLSALFCAIMIHALFALPFLARAQSGLPIKWVRSQITVPFEVAYSPNGSELAIGGNGGVQIWNIATGVYKDLPTSATAGVNTLAYSPNGSELAVAGNSGSMGVLELWDVGSGTLLKTLSTGQIYVINTLSFSPNGKLIADGGFNASGGMLELWNVSTGKRSALSTSDVQGVFSLAFTPDSKTIADSGSSSTGSNTIEMWNVLTGKLTGTLESTESDVYAVAFSPDGKTLADGGIGANSSGNSVGMLELWKVATAKLEKSLTSAANSGIDGVVFSPDGKTLADGGSGTSATVQSFGVLELWNVSTYKLTESLDTTTNGGGVYSLAFSPNGKTIADGGPTAAGGVVETWKVSTGALISKVDGPSSSGVNTVTISSDAKTVASGGTSVTSRINSGVLELWSTSTGKTSKNLNTANSIVNSVAISKDDKTLADGGVIYSSNGNHAGAALELWSVSTGKLSQTLKTAADIVQSVSISPDGNTLADGGVLMNSSGTPTGGVVELWSISTGKLITSLSTTANYGVNVVTFSPDGESLAVGGIALNNQNQTTGVVEIWNVATEKLVEALGTTADGGVRSLAFSANGKMLADGGSYSSDGTQIGLLELWNVAKWKLLGSPTFLQNTNQVNSVGFSPNGSAVFAGTNLCLEAFSTATYRLLHYYSAGQVSSLSVSSIDGLLAYGSSTSSLVLASDPY